MKATYNKFEKSRMMVEKKKMQVVNFGVKTS
jgi:hypothetical protein